MALKEEPGDEKPTEDAGRCHPRYLVSLPGGLRVLNVVLGAIILGLWIPGYEHDYRKANQIVSFRDITKNYGAGYKSETLNQFVLADIIICLFASLCLLVALVVVAHSHVDWNRMNKIAHGGLAMFHGVGAICAIAGTLYFEENCCRVDLEWNGIGFRYKPGIQEFGYPRNNYRCNCWLTKRSTSSPTNPDVEQVTRYTTEIWEHEHYPDKYVQEESMFVSFAAHHVHVHVAAVVLMMLNAGVYALASFFSKSQAEVKSQDDENENGT